MSSACAHPESAIYVDRVQGTAHCTLCGDVLQDTKFEMDRVFARGTGASGGPSGGLRALGGSLRPSRGTAGSAWDSGSHPRPSLDAARRKMLQIARTLEISDDIVERALGIYKVAASMNAISGTRTVVLCACLYAACRRERTSHVIYDFSELYHDSPLSIMSHMRHICEATHTDVPVADPSCLVQRFAEQMDLGERTAEVVVCALKVLRAMKDDWIACGRRPMGVCAAALLVACYLFRINYTPEQVCGMVRLTSNTITKRLQEFSATPAASLVSIDDYSQSGATLPPAFGSASLQSTEDDVHAEMRLLSSIYYELVEEAKTSCEATPERCAKWRQFITAHCQLESITPSEDNLDLLRLTPEAQLHILGLPHTKPMAAQQVSASVKREEEKLVIKQEQTQSSSQDPFASHHVSMRGVRGTKPEVMLKREQHDMMDGVESQFRQLLQNEEVRGLQNDFDFSTEEDNQFADLFGAPTQLSNYGLPQDAPSSPAAAEPEVPALTDEEREAASQAALEQILFDQERRHALPWQIVVLQSPEQEDATDILKYLVLDNEERLRHEMVGQSLYGEKWQRGRARTAEEIDDLELGRQVKRRRRHVIAEPQSLPDALGRVLRGRGAGTINVSHVRELIPDLLGEDEGEITDDWD